MQDNVEWGKGFWVVFYKSIHGTQPDTIHEIIVRTEQGQFISGEVASKDSEGNRSRENIPGSRR